MADLFKEIIPSILKTKKNVFEDDVEYKSYVPYIINKALSYHVDCILPVNEMNRLSFLNKDVQYSFYINIIRAHNRKYQSWHKKEKMDNIDMVKEYFGFSNEKAKQALRLLSRDDIDEIKKKNNKGGLHDSSGHTH